MRYVLTVVVLTALAAPAAAQPAPWEPERLDAGWIFRPAIVLGGMWDSNVTVRNDPNNLNPEIAEWVGIVNPRGSIDFNGKRAKFNAGYSGRLETYRTLDELTRYDQRGRVDASYLMTPRLTFNTRHQLTLAPSTDQLETLSGIPFTRVGSTMMTSGGGFTAALTRRMKLATSYAFQWVEFDRDPRFQRLRGGHQHSPSVELKYAFSRRLDVGGAWMYHHASIDGAEEIIDSQQGAVVAEYVLGPETKIRGMAGAAYLRVAETGESRTGPAYGASVSHLIREVAIDGGFDRSFVPSFGFGGMTAKQEVYARVHVPFARGRMFASGGVAFRRNTPVLTTSFPIELSTTWTNGTFGYAITRWLRTEAFVTVNHQTSSAQGNVDRTRVGIQFVTSKPMRIQ
jgi:hypothetical protein